MPPEQRRTQSEFQSERVESSQRSDQNADSCCVGVCPLQLTTSRQKNVAVLVTVLQGQLRL